MTIETLQIIWIMLVVVILAVYAILAGFDLGVGFWHLFAKNESEKGVAIKAIGPYWDGNQVWLLTGAGALFAAFPPMYATIFSTFYLPMMLVLLGLIFRTVAIEFRGKIEEASWKKRWDTAFSWGSILPTVLFGVASGNIVRGLPLDNAGNYAGTFFNLLNPYSLIFGLVFLSAFALQGAAFLSLKMGDFSLAERARGWTRKTLSVHLVLVAILAVWTLISYCRGNCVLPIIFLLLTVLAYAATYLFSKKNKDLLCFLASSASVLTTALVFVSIIFPEIVLSTGPGPSLSIVNASSSYNTLVAMLIIAGIGMPVVIGYTFFIYRVFKNRES